MKVIAVMSPKGGVAKTTTADSIAYILGEEQEKKVLILDGDPQGDTSKTFGCYESAEVGMSKLLECHVCVGGDYHTEDLIWPTKYPHIDMIPVPHGLRSNAKSGRKPDHKAQGGSCRGIRRLRLLYM